ncbi:MAG: hypothetical protein C6W57_08720 [Caldibacillus debilis]|jgi:hypothetical protein|nr:MAG: hypothetical protein C6W57_08720 [Caldibacillus debilis]
MLSRKQGTAKFRPARRVPPGLCPLPALFKETALLPFDGTGREVWVKIFSGRLLDRYFRSPHTDMDPCRATSGTYIVGSLLFFAYWIDPEPKKIYTYVSVAFSLLFFADRVPSVPFFRAGSAFGTGFPRFQPAIRKPRPLFIGKNPKKIKNEYRPLPGQYSFFFFMPF